jgi:hypothetical protein
MPNTDLNGTRAPAFIKSNFFVFLMGQFVTIIGAALYFGGLINQVSDIQKWRGQAQLTLERMDRDGTNMDRWRLDQLNKSFDVIDRRTAKIDVMDATLNRIDKKMDEISRK